MHEIIITRIQHNAIAKYSKEKTLPEQTNEGYVNTEIELFDNHFNNYHLSFRFDKVCALLCRNAFTEFEWLQPPFGRKQIQKNKTSS